MGQIQGQGQIRVTANDHASFLQSINRRPEISLDNLPFQSEARNLTRDRFLGDWFALC